MKTGGYQDNSLHVGLKDMDGPKSFCVWVRACIPQPLRRGADDKAFVYCVLYMSCVIGYVGIIRNGRPFKPTPLKNTKKLDIKARTQRRSVYCKYEEITAATPHVCFRLGIKNV